MTISLAKPERVWLKNFPPFFVDLPRIGKINHHPPLSSRKTDPFHSTHVFTTWSRSTQDYHTCPPIVPYGLSHRVLAVFPLLVYVARVVQVAATTPYHPQLGTVQRRRRMFGYISDIPSNTETGIANDNGDIQDGKLNVWTNFLTRLFTQPRHLQSDMKKNMQV